jgi:hypothetical protein
VDWFIVIRKELTDPFVLIENTYNIDETGVLLSVLNLLKVLVDKNEFRNYKGARVKHTLITIVEYILINGRYLYPLIIWPAIIY